MAVGYSYAILRDFQFAEDAAQEAFFEAYRNLPNLKEPAAFPGWFRRIVYKQCDRIIRRRDIATVPLELIDDHASQTKAPQTKDLERREMRERLWKALDCCRNTNELQPCSTTLADTRSRKSANFSARL